MYSNYNLFLEGVAFVKKLSSFLRPYNGKSFAYKGVASMLVKGKYFNKSMRYLKKSAKIAKVFDLTESNEHKMEMQMLWGDCLKGLKNYGSAVRTYLQIVNRNDEGENLAS